MFQPRTTGSVENSKRRHRAGSDGSVKPPKAKRHRTLRQEKGESSPDIAGDVQQESELGEVAGMPESGKPMVIRGPRKAGKQGGCSDDTVILSNTDFYVVSQLPGVPDQISGLHSESFRCTFGSEHGYALSLTPSHAIIWAYSISPSSSSSADIFTLSIPDSCRGDRGAIPYGVLLSTATSGAPGLLVVVPATGKIIYWENVSSAGSFGIPRQKQNGLQGSIPGLLSGEHAVDIVNGEPSGVLVTLSSGRVAHVSIRDSQGKPAVMVHFLQNRAKQNNGGILGGIKNVLGGGFWRKDVAATKAGESHQRGQRDIIIATLSGHVEIWDTHWNSGSFLKEQFDVKKDVCKAIGPDGMDGADEKDVTIEDVGLATAEHTNGLHTLRGDSWSLFLVVAPSRNLDSKGLYVVHIDLSRFETRIISTRPVDLRNIPTTLRGCKPKLLVPRTGDTAFIVLGQSVILMSLASPGESPSSQLLINSAQQLPIFQDSINFRTEREYEILGTDVEDQRGDGSCPACLAMVRGFGIIRITALPRSRTENGFEDATVTAKDKLEQAVFYGSMLGNPLNLVGQGGLDFPAQEIEEAAVEICRELLRSKSKFIPTAAISLDQNLRFRAKALDDLASFLMKQGNPLNHMAWWELLWGAEKLAAQRAMWKIEEGCRRELGKKSTFLAHVIGLMSGKFKTKYEAYGDADDPVRHWFLYDTYQMEHAVPWIYNAAKSQKGSSSRQEQRMPEQILKASDFSLAILETAFRYRDENASRYGLDEDLFEDGILIAGYENLPEFWTSQRMSYAETSNLLDLQLDSCRAYVQRMDLTSEPPDNQIVKEVARNSAAQIRVLGQMHCERIRWLSAQGDPRLIDEGDAIEQSHVKQRKWQIFKLAGIGQLGDAISLAEKFRDMGVLVELMIELQDETECQNLPQILSKKSPDLAGNEAGEIGRKLLYYFENFGEAWSNTFFTRQISMGHSGMLLALKSFQPFVTQFLRKSPAYSRLSWINDVIGENDYDSAAKTLKNVVVERESDIWCHHVELSLAKLTRLASRETDKTDTTSSQDDIRWLENRTEVDAIQEAIYAQTLPILQGAIDQKAEIELAIEHFGRIVTEDRASLQEVLCDVLAGVVSKRVIAPDQLVDLLTLMDSSQSDNEFWGQEFFMALRVVQFSDYRLQDPMYHSALQKLVWRRCMIRDNWEARGKADGTFGNEVEASVHDTALFRTLTLCLREKNDEENGQPTLYIPRTVSELLLSRSDSDALVSRFRLEQRIRIGQDLERENEILCRYLEKGRLEFSFKSLLASAQGAVAIPLGTEDSGSDR